jgi:hypothetical protein
MSEKPQKPSQSYRDLIAWQKGMALAKSIYRLTARFPNEEKFGLISQLIQELRKMLNALRRSVSSP